MVRPAGFEQRVWAVTTLSSLTAPTAAQINAGVEITADLPAPINFSGTTNYIDVSDISTAQDKQQTGTISIDNMEFEIYRHKAASQLAYDALPNSTVRYLVKFEGGGIAGASPAAGDKCDVAAVTVGIKTDVASPRNDSRRARVPVAVNEAIAWRSTVA
jgi:hypothetical protein